jgi:uncharacterized protein YjiS (DUF1127 family)
MTLYEHFQLWLVARHAERRTLAELSCYTDRELGDLGLSRADIAGIAREAGRMAADESRRGLAAGRTGHGWTIRHA